MFNKKWRFKATMTTPSGPILVIIFACNWLSRAILWTMKYHNSIWTVGMYDFAGNTYRLQCTTINRSQPEGSLKSTWRCLLSLQKIWKQRKFDINLLYGRTKKIKTMRVSWTAKTLPCTGGVHTITKRAYWCCYLIWLRCINGFLLRLRIG